MTKAEDIPRKDVTMASEGKFSIKSQTEKGDYELTFGDNQKQYKIICEDVIDHRSYSHNLKMKFKPENPGLNRIQTHDYCDTGAVLYQLSYQVNWVLVVTL